MWKKFWQWFQGWLRRLFGRSRQIQVSHKQQENVQPLFYKNYEFLFLRLLEGVAGGWQEQQALEFLAEWENRTTEADWIAWLHSFGERTLYSRSPNVELGRRMLLLSQVGCGELGRVAGEFGEELLRRSSPIQAGSNSQDAIAPFLSSKTHRKSEKNASALGSANLLKIENIASLHLRAKEINAIASKSQHKNIIEQHIFPENTPLGKTPGRIKRQPPPDSLEGVLTMLQENDGMVKQLARQMGMQTSNPQVILRELEIRALIKEGLKFKKAGNLSRAIACCDRALSRKPDYHIAWAMRGDMLFKLERYEMAVASYNRATELKPDDWEAWYNQGMTLFKLSRLPAAVESFQQSLKLKPDFVQSWKNLAIALFNLKLYSEAIASCEQALKIQPQDQVVITCMENSRAALRHQDDV